MSRSKYPFVAFEMHFDIARWRPNMGARRPRHPANFFLETCQSRAFSRRLDVVKVRDKDRSGRVE